LYSASISASMAVRCRMSSSIRVILKLKASQLDTLPLLIESIAVPNRMVR